MSPAIESQHAGDLDEVAGEIRWVDIWMVGGWLGGARNGTHTLLGRL